MTPNPLERGMVPQYALAAGVIIAFLSLLGVAVAPESEPLATIRMEPQTGLVLKDNVFPVRIMVDASTPVNVFKGELHFDYTKLHVESIDYNISIAELWAEKPWYANGDGTINFIGGTPRPGGFSGSGVLMTVNFRPIALGDAELKMIDPRVLAHDGLGSDVLVSQPLDALFVVENQTIVEETISQGPDSSASVAVVEMLPRTDLNQDGKQSIIDISIFVAKMLTKDPSLDFNSDGSVDTKDLSIIMSVK